MPNDNSQVGDSSADQVNGWAIETERTCLSKPAGADTPALDVGTFLTILSSGWQIYQLLQKPNASSEDYAKVLSLLRSIYGAINSLTAHVMAIGVQINAKFDQLIVAELEAKMMRIGENMPRWRDEDYKSADFEQEVASLQTARAKIMVWGPAVFPHMLGTLAIETQLLQLLGWKKSIPGALASYEAYFIDSVLNPNTSGSLSHTANALDRQVSEKLAEYPDSDRRRVWLGHKSTTKLVGHHWCSGDVFGFVTGSCVQAVPFTGVVDHRIDNYREGFVVDADRGPRGGHNLVQAAPRGELIDFGQQRLVEILRGWNDAHQTVQKSLMRKAALRGQATQVHDAVKWITTVRKTL